MVIQHIIVMISALCAATSRAGWNDGYESGSTLSFNTITTTEKTETTKSYECNPCYWSKYDLSTETYIYTVIACIDPCKEVGSNRSYSLDVKYNNIWKSVSSSFNKTSSIGYIKFNGWSRKVTLSSSKDYKPDPPFYGTLQFRLSYGTKNTEFTMEYQDCTVKYMGWETYNSKVTKETTSASFKLKEAHYNSDCPGSVSYHPVLTQD